MAVSLSIRRLFHQHTDPDAVPVTGRDLGFRGKAGRAVLRDEHRLAELHAADTSDDRMQAAYDYFYKVRKHTETAASARADNDTLAALDGARERIAAAIIAELGTLDRHLTTRGYADDVAELEVTEPF